MRPPHGPPRDPDVTGHPAARVSRVPQACGQPRDLVGRARQSRDAGPGRGEGRRRRRPDAAARPGHQRHPAAHRLSTRLVHGSLLLSFFPFRRASPASRTRAIRANARVERLSRAMIIFQANSLFGQLPYPLSRFRFERYMTPYAYMKGIQVLHYATASFNIGAVEGG